MHLVMLDTCVWLPISSKKQSCQSDVHWHMVREGIIKLLVPELLRTQFERNKGKKF